MQIIEGNILDITSGIICHQVNCRGVFNVGLAKQIRKKYPEAYRRYMGYHKQFGWELGEIQIVQVSKDLVICNIAGQDDYGNDGYCYTNYSFLKQGIERLKALTDRQIYFPYGMGCGYAGGDWNIVSGIIDEVIPDAIVVKWANAR
jgi:O-acetyl-ADP-ribose deacetylase (regulator of RNase III)